MNWQLMSYIIYLIITYWVTVVVGKKFYTQGEIFIREILQDPGLTLFINRMLLIGYYLLNLGYATVGLAFWDKVNTLNDLVEGVSYHTALILLILGLMHYINMLAIKLIHYLQTKIHRHGN